jgi:SAM-dependent methyltransferase
VVATDLDTGFLEELDEKNLEVRRHDIVTDELEEDTFDLVHARLVLSHLPARDGVLRRLTRALVPGGWLVVEDFDWDTGRVAADCPNRELLERAHDLIHQAMTAAGYSGPFGRQLALQFQAEGLVGVGAEGRTLVALAGTPAAGWWQLNLLKFRPVLLQAGLTEADADEVVGLPDRDCFCFQYPTLITAWGRRPLA